MTTRQRKPDPVADAIRAAFRDQRAALAAAFRDGTISEHRRESGRAAAAAEAARKQQQQADDTEQEGDA